MDAVTGKEDQPDAGIAEPRGELADGMERRSAIGIAAIDDVEAEGFELGRHVFGVFGGVVEVRQKLIAVVADNQRHAPFGRQAGCGDKHRQRQEDAPNALHILGD